MSIRFPLATVANKRENKVTPLDQYVGRPSAYKGGELKWGNPFVIGKDGDRQEVILKYNAWLDNGYGFNNSYATSKQRQWVLENIPRLIGRRLVCWCYPEPCHADELARRANIIATLQNL